MSIKIENTPSPSVLMNSMRSIGYTFKTALADIVDNSISASAKNVWIDVPVNDNDLYITILDDGNGMSRGDLFNAMKYGSDRDYTSEDLGRFGLGLKSASLSQCRILTVVSKNNEELSGFQWNLDAVIQGKKWDCIELEREEIEDTPNVQRLLSFDMGTLVVWQNFDIAYKKSNGRIREYLSDEMAEAEKHLALVFHRYLSNRFKPFKIYVNNDAIEALDPFLEDHPKTDSKKVSEVSMEGGIIKVQPFILPHMSDLSDTDISKLGGLEALRNDQGFYIYRNDRLIIYGKWFRLSSSSVSPELLKYGRIKVDIPNSLDDIWDIDIKKQNATIPKQVLNYLKKAVTDVCSRSKEKTSKRVRLRFADFHDSEQKIALFEFFDTIITIGLNMPVDKSKLEKSIQEMIDCEKYSDAIINNPPLFIPSRKFLPMPICPQCRNEMKLTIKDDQTVYECSNVSCGQIMPLSIKQ